MASLLLPGFSRARESGRRSACLSNLRQIGLGVQLYVQDNDNGFVPAYSALSEPLDSPGTCAKSRVFGGWWGEILMPYIKNSQVFQCPSTRVPTKVAVIETTWLNTCPAPTPAPAPTATPSPSGGGGGGSGSSCPSVAAHVANPQYYSYAFNALSNNNIFWSHSPSLVAGRSGFNSSVAAVSCVVSWYARPVSLNTVQHPEDTIWLADGEISAGTLASPQFFADDHLDYANTSLRRLARRHHEGFNALFADGHVKWQLTSRPSQWTVQDD